MTVRADEVAGSWRKARIRQHRAASHAGGVVRFAMDAGFWAAVGAAIAWIVLMWTGSGTEHLGFMEFGGPSETDPTTEFVAVAIIAAAFGLLMAWCCKRVRDADRARSLATPGREPDRADRG